MKTSQEIALAYKSPPFWYDIRGFFILKLTYRCSLFSQIRFFARNMGPQHLEVAVGSGSLLKIILWWRRFKKFPTVNILGVDYAETMLAGAIHTFKNHKNINFKLADVAKMDVENNCFDTANIANAIHCFPDVDGALREIYRVLKPGGKLAANVLLFPQSGGKIALKIAGSINDWGIRKGILVTPYQSKDIRGRFESAGFVVDEENVEGNSYSIILHKPAI